MPGHVCHGLAGAHFSVKRHPARPAGAPLATRAVRALFLSMPGKREIEDVADIETQTQPRARQRKACRTNPEPHGTDTGRSRGRNHCIHRGSVGGSRAWLSGGPSRSAGTCMSAISSRRGHVDPGRGDLLPDVGRVGAQCGRGGCQDASAGTATSRLCGEVAFPVQGIAYPGTVRGRAELFLQSAVEPGRRPNRDEYGRKIRSRRQRDVAGSLSP